MLSDLRRRGLREPGRPDRGRAVASGGPLENGPGHESSFPGPLYPGPGTARSPELIFFGCGMSSPSVRGSLWPGTRGQSERRQAKQRHVEFDSCYFCAIVT